MFAGRRVLGGLVWLGLGEKKEEGGNWLTTFAKLQEKKAQSDLRTPMFPQQERRSQIRHSFECQKNRDAPRSHHRFPAENRSTGCFASNKIA
jgi:hypothetical protein